MAAEPKRWQKIKVRGRMHTEDDEDYDWWEIHEYGSDNLTIATVFAGADADLIIANHEAAALVKAADVERNEALDLKRIAEAEATAFHERWTEARDNYDVAVTRAEQAEETIRQQALVIAANESVQVQSLHTDLEEAERELADWQEGRRLNMAATVENYTDLKLRLEQSEALLTAAQAAAWGECFTLPDGDCLGHGCMHDEPYQKAGTALRFIARTTSNKPLRDMALAALNLPSANIK